MVLVTALPGGSIGNDLALSVLPNLRARRAGRSRGFDINAGVVVSSSDPDLAVHGRLDGNRLSTSRASDCLVLEPARKAGHLPLGTLDHELGKLTLFSGLVPQ